LKAALNIPSILFNLKDAINHFLGDDVMGSRLLYFKLLNQCSISVQAIRIVEVLRLTF